MRLDVFITVKNIEDSINFYVTELGLFEISQDYGMGNILLRYINNKSFCILLEEDELYKH
jgi:predicted lactoylglutathione lyase